MAEVFDPIAVLQALDDQRVTYIVIGGLGRVIHGSDELTDGIDIVPSTRDENLRRLGLALDELNARGPDGKPPVLERDLAGKPVLELQDRCRRAEDRARAGGDARLRRPAPRREPRAARARGPTFGRLTR